MYKVLFRSMLVTSLRDKITLFYSLLLPVALMLGLGLYFNESEQQLRIICGITAVSTLFWGMQGIAFQILWQRNRGVYKLLKLTPMPLAAFIAVMVVTRSIIGIAIHTVVWLFGIICFQLPMSASSIAITLLIIVIGTLCFTSIGFVLANAARNEAQINMLSNMLQFPMIFMSSAFYSLSSAPQWVSIVGKLLPFEHYAKLLVSASLGGESTSMGSVIIPIVYMFIAMLIATVTFRWDSEIRQQKAKRLVMKMRD